MIFHFFSKNWRNLISYTMFAMHSTENITE